MGAEPAGEHADRYAASAIPVLLYHSVDDSPDTGIARFASPAAEFGEHVEAIAACGRRAVSFRELGRLLAAGEAGGEPLVCVTFDDGWADNLAAARRLAEAGLPATFFVTSGFVGRPRMLDAAALRELASLGNVEIGAHTATHARLDELPPGAAAAEVAGGRDALEELAGVKVTTFAYPHGSYDAAVRRLVADSGFTAAAAVKNALSHPGDDPFAVARLTVRRETSAAEIRRWLAGEGAPLAWAGERARTKAFRAVRRARARLGRGPAAAAGALSRGDDA